MVILVIESNYNFATQIRDNLERDGHEVYTAYDGTTGLATALSRRLDMVIMERIMPDMDGVHICQEIMKRHDIPLLMISDITDRNDKILCIGLGAEDYMEKPLRPVDILYRVRKIIKRREELAIEEERKLLSYKNILTIDPEEQKVIIDEKEVYFTGKEYELLLFFMTHRGKVYHKSEIYKYIWKEPEYYDTGYVTTYINRLRTKLKKYNLKPIKTIRTKGYMWSEN